MMKKAMSVLLAVMLLLFTFGASAESFRFTEDSSDFDISMLLPEGAVVDSQRGVGDLSLVTVTKEGLASVRISIAPTDEYDKESMNDLSEEDIEHLKQLSATEFDDPIITVEVTLLGNKYIHVCANDAESDSDAIFTLYKGYFIEMTQWHEDYSEITDADYAFMQQLLYNVEFTELK